MSLSDVKTVGVPGELGKDFQLSYKGTTLTAKRLSGGSWGIKLGLFDHRCETVRECKLALIDHLDKPCDAATSKLGIWDCVDPCALLVDDYRHKKVDPTLLRTLDCHGWIDQETGEPDYDRAAREIERFNKLRQAK